MAKVFAEGGAGAAFPSLRPTGQGFSVGTIQADILPHGARVRLAIEQPPDDFTAILLDLDRRLTRLGVPHRCWDGWPINQQRITDLLLQNHDPMTGARFPFDDECVAEFDGWRAGPEGQRRPFKEENEANWAVMARWIIRAVPTARPDQLFALGRLLGIGEANLRHPERFLEIQGHNVRTALGTTHSDPFVAWILEQYAVRRGRGDAHMKACRGILNDTEYEKRRTVAGKPRPSLNTFQRWVGNNSG